MAQGKKTAVVIVEFGGDEFLRHRALASAKKECMAANPQAEVIELDASQTEPFEFEEAVSPTLLSSASVVLLSNLENSSDELAAALKQFAAQPSTASVVVAEHDGSMKGRKNVEALAKLGARINKPSKLKSESEKKSFVTGEFKRNGRSITADALNRLVAVLGERTAELAAMCQQLCFDFDENPITLPLVMNYLDATPEVTGFAVADAAIEGNPALAVLKLRQAVKRGVEPLALIGAIASKLRAMGKAAAVQAGRVRAEDLHMNSWFLQNSMRQVRGWSSQGLGTCIEALAHADSEAKSTSGDPLFALEQAVELIARKGSQLQLA